MAGNRSASRAVTNGNHKHLTNGHDLPPQSTYAAKLVRDHANDARHSTSTAGEGFTELLQEILRHDSPPETDPEVNFKAIKVVFEAGLEVLSVADNIPPDSVLLDQAVQSVAVIHKIIDQQPQLLFHGQTDHQLGSPLVVSLFARLIEIMSPSYGVSLRSEISSLLAAVLRAPSTSLKVWKHSDTIKQIFRDAVDDLIQALRKTAVHHGKLSNNSFVLLPPTRSITRFNGSHALATTLTSAEQHSVTKTADATDIAHLLLEAMARSISTDSDFPMLSPLGLWVLDATADLSQVICKTHPLPDTINHYLQVLANHFEFLRSLAANFPRLAAVLTHHCCRCIVRMLDISNGREISTDIVLQLSAFINDVLTMRLDSDDVETLAQIIKPEQQGLPADLRQAIFLIQKKIEAATSPVSSGATDGDVAKDVAMSEFVGVLSFTEHYDLKGILQSLRQLLPSSPVQDSGLPIPSRTVYTALSIESRECLWTLLSLLPCAANGSNGDAPCQDCLNQTRPFPALYNGHDTVTRSWIQDTDVGSLLKTLVVFPELQTSARCRVLAAECIRTYVNHTTTTNHVKIGESGLAEWCLRALTSSTRDLRFASARALVTFLRVGIEPQTRDDNRRLTLEYLRGLSELCSPDQRETVIFVWSQVATTCGDRERNLALLQFVDFLGSTNTLTSAVAFYELQKIAAEFQQGPYELMRPFWKTIAVSIVRDLFKKPQKAKYMVEFLHTTVPHFLVFTQTATVPFLILTKRADVLRKIAQARGTGTTVQDVFLRPKSTMAAVFALLLSQPTDDRVGFVTAMFNELAPGWKKQDVANLIGVEPSIITVELLKMAGDEDQEKKEQSHQAIRVIASIVRGKPGNTPSGSRGAQLLGSYFEFDVLGIMASISDTIERKDDTALHQDKVRCLKAVEEMLTLATTHITIAAPQIRACLQSAIDQRNLIDPAISAWLVLLTSLEGEDAVPLLDHLFSVIVQHWSSMSPEIQQKTYDTVAWLLKTHNDLVREQIIMVPSLADIPLMSKFEVEIDRLKSGESLEKFVEAFTARLQDENASIVLQAAHELQPWLNRNQDFIHDAVISESPSPAIGAIVRALLDVTVKYNSARPEIADSAAVCLGAIGAIDPHRVEANVSEPQVLVLSNFELTRECTSWVAFMFTETLVPAFKSSTNARAQGFLAWVLQELLKISGFKTIETTRLRASQSNDAQEAWTSLPENVQNILTPFLSSRYSLTSNVNVKEETYPIFHAGVKHETWLRKWVYDMLWRGKGNNPKIYFSILARAIRDHDINIAKTMLPYATLNIALGGDEKEVDQIAAELLIVLSTESSVPLEQETLRLCSENVFSVLDYMTRWTQEKKRTLAATRQAYVRAGHPPSDFDVEIPQAQIAAIEKVVNSIPANIIAQRAIECGSYARALFHWENFIRENRDKDRMDSSTRDVMYTRLQSIYSEIDEPDGLDGIAAQINILTPEQQAFQHLRAGRWFAAQSWYEIELASRPLDEDMQVGLLTCLKESGQSNQVFRTALDMMGSDLHTKHGTRQSRLLPIATEAAWSTSQLSTIQREIERAVTMPTSCDFNVAIGRILLELEAGNEDQANSRLRELRSVVSRSLSTANTSSLGACHSQLLQLHVIQELSQITILRKEEADETKLTALSSSLDRRLSILGSSTADKQFVLGLRRAALPHIGMNVESELGKSWLTTARLARKADVVNAANYAVLRAAMCGDGTSKIEQARLLWKNGQHRQAIHSLQGAIDSNAFATFETDRRTETLTGVDASKQNMLAARAHLLLAKWLDASGQSQALAVTAKYQYAAKTYARWEKGHYYLGKHYNALREAEMVQPAAKQKEAYITGELTKLVVENFLRSIPFGSKYWYETIPKLITLWLDLGMECISKPRDISSEIFERRNKWLHHIHSQIRKYYERVQRYVFYNALPQMISRISHPNPKVVEVLLVMILGVVSAHPAQALWAALPVTKATAPDRAARGKELVARLKEGKNRKTESGALELRSMVMQGQKLQDGLLNASEMSIEGRASNVSLSRDLKFNVNLAPSKLVIPFQHLLTPNVPTVQDSGYIRTFKAFAQTPVTITKFLDDVLVMNSIQRPRKLTVLGSDGNQYGLLCKPKDDLRKDQRLMEFNTMINRALKRDPDSSKRRLYIRTYGVTPLSEESGTIEWVEGIKPLRDILLKLYSRKGISPNYGQLRSLLNEASGHPDNYHIFSTVVLPSFPAVLHEWFTETFASAGAWFASRIRFARSAAVMSMVGHVLGLGDRHGENILLEESGGGVLHVDFNCLFDKGLTFEKPELVPFRLTHNMVDAMGGPVLGVEGPFRRSAEITLATLRQNMDTLMNVLETFLHDPTTDFIGKKKSRHVPGVPETPAEVLESVKLKLRGFLGGESVPLGVEGQVQALISMAVDEAHLCRMYFGWCAFL